MGAHQSIAAHGGVRLRRRAGTTAHATHDEIEGAGVDLAKAVATIAMLQQQGELKGTATEPTTPPVPQRLSKVGGTKGSEARQSAIRSSAIELPPWEVVAHLSESDWVALRAWIEAGWR